MPNTYSRKKMRISPGRLIILFGFWGIFLILPYNTAYAQEAGEEAKNRSDWLSSAEDNLALKKRIEELERDKSLLESMLSLRQAQIRQPSLARMDENPDKIIHLNLGYAYGSKERIDEAIIEYQKALQYDPKDKDIHYNLGLLLGRKNRYKEALKEYEKSIKGNAEDREVYYNMAVIYAGGLKDQESAKQYLEKFLGTPPGDR